jgi:hypothetical protein
MLSAEGRSLMRKTGERERAGAPELLQSCRWMVTWLIGLSTWGGGGGIFLKEGEKFAKTSERLEWMELGR